jgi:hypothetical protein
LLSPARASNARHRALAPAAAARAQQQQQQQHHQQQQQSTAAPKVVVSVCVCVGGGGQGPTACRQRQRALPEAFINTPLPRHTQRHSAPSNTRRPRHHHSMCPTSWPPSQQQRCWQRRACWHPS